MLEKLLKYLGIHKDADTEESNFEWWEAEFLFGNPFSEEDYENIKLGRGPRPLGVSNAKLPLIGRNPHDSKWACQIKGCNRPSQFTIITTAKLDIDTPYLNRMLGEQVLASYHWYHLCDNCLHDYYQSNNIAPILIEGDDRARLIYNSATGKEVTY